jgi:hypothetical protein
LGVDGVDNVAYVDGEEDGRETTTLCNTHVALKLLRVRGIEEEELLLREALSDELSEAAREVFCFKGLTEELAIDGWEG